jgi:hypothetical protein
MIVRYQEKVNIDTKANIEYCAFSNDDSLVFCADGRGVVYLFNSTNGDQIGRLKLNNCDVKSIILIPGKI